MTETDGQPMHDDDLRVLLQTALGPVHGLSDPDEAPATPDDPTQPGALEDLRMRVAAGVAAEDARPLATLRQRPTWQRQLVGVGALVLLVGTTFVAMPRADLALYPVWRLVLELGTYALAYMLCLLVALRGAHLPSLSPRVTYALATGAIALVGLVGLLPAPHEHGEHVSRGLAELLSPCAVVGVMVALPVYALVRLLDRGSSLSAVAAAGAAGLAGNSLLQMHCANTQSAHMLLGHAAVGVWLLLGVALARVAERRSARA